MVKGFFKSIFFTTETLPYKVFPLPHLLLPDRIEGVYHQYYQLGTGHIVLLALLFLIIFQMIWGKAFERAVARLSLIILGFWTVLPTEVYQFNLSAFPTNVYFLPILRIPLAVLYIIQGILLSFLFVSLSNNIKSVVRPSIHKLFTAVSVLLLLFLLLPLFSGELWAD